MIQPDRILIATSSPGKSAEINSLLTSLSSKTGIVVGTLDAFGFKAPYVNETGTSFVDNALIKAKTYAEQFGLYAMADDSGLCVDALNGEPGIQSARWAGPLASDKDRIALLMSRLQGVPLAQRTAQFVCAIAVASPSGKFVFSEGYCNGIILESGFGVGGFGYDPVFLLPELGKTFAELTITEKNQVSHRAIALSLIGTKLYQMLGFGNSNPNACLEDDISG